VCRIIPAWTFKLPTINTFLSRCAEKPTVIDGNDFIRVMACASLACLSPFNILSNQQRLSSVHQRTWRPLQRYLRVKVSFGYSKSY
jgi:hypothetical protein